METDNETYSINDVMKELKSLNNKIDNFLGFEMINEKELKQLEEIDKEGFADKKEVEDILNQN